MQGFINSFEMDAETVERHANSASSETLRLVYADRVYLFEFHISLKFKLN